MASKSSERTVSRSTWLDLVKIASSPRPHDRATWLAHREIFQAWLDAQLREQAGQLRQFLVGNPLAADGFCAEDWEYLIPAGENNVSRMLFMSDLASFFRVLGNRNKTVAVESADAIAAFPMPSWYMSATSPNYLETPTLKVF